MRGRSRYARLAAGVVFAVVACSSVLVGCAAPKATTATRTDIERAIEQGQLPAGARVTELLPSASLTRQDAERAASGMRSAMIDGHESSPSWLSVRSDGSFEATGYFGGESGTSQTWDGRVRSFATLQVPEKVGGLDIVHAVPLMVFDDTPVLLNGKPVKFSSLTASDGSSPISVGDYWVVATFSVQEGWIRADSITYTNRESTWGAWPDDYPAHAATDEWRLYQDAGAATGSGARWLDIKGGGGPVLLQGYQQGAMTIVPAPKTGFVGSIDLTIPDRLGPAAIYHVVQVFFTDEHLVPKDPGVAGGSARAFPVTTVRVRLDHGKVVAVGG
jgi:hypothetical protein